MLKKEKKIICPDCQSIIVGEKHMEIGDILECGECGCEVEITSINPLLYRELIEQK